jgi:hypothetical protein
VTPASVEDQIVPMKFQTTGEVRKTSSTGGQKGQKPQRMDLIPWNAVMKISEIYGFGAEKYDDHNWRKGYDFSLSFGAMMRHLALYWEGEDNDQESGLPHLAHAGFHIFALLEGMELRPQFDDRWATKHRSSPIGDDEFLKHAERVQEYLERTTAQHPKHPALDFQ